MRVLARHGARLPLDEVVANRILGSPATEIGHEKATQYMSWGIHLMTVYHAFAAKLASNARARTPTYAVSLRAPRMMVIT
jgi:hypothetical protein